MKWYESLAELNLNHKAWLWLQNPNSLTKFLKKQAGHETLTIHLLNQQWRAPSLQEQKRLDISGLHEVLERKIFMSVMNKPWLYARTYFSKKASHYFGNDLNKLSSNSLGELIAHAYPQIVRGSFEFAFVTSNDSLFTDIFNILQQYNSNLSMMLQRDLTNSILRDKLIVRRSLFYLHQDILFNIDEIFLPALINKILNLEVMAT